MRLRQISSDSWELQGLHLILIEMLQELPEISAAHEAAKDRLYPDPMGGARGEEEFCSDWEEHVRPDLERLFATNRELVAKDLKELHKDKGTLVLRRENVDAWLSALNQARFITVATHGIEEEDMADTSPPDLTTRKGAALLRVQFYGVLQEMLLSEIY